MSQLVRRFVREDQGQDLVEYAMLLALIAVVVAVGVTTFGTALQQFYNGLFARIPLGAP
jgi:pilus assembly protein Flp/PilA